MPVPFDEIDVVEPGVVWLLLMLVGGRPLKPDDNCVSSSFGVKTDDRCDDDIGSRHTLVAGWPTDKAIEPRFRGKPSSSAPKSDGPHGLKNPDGADGEWHTTPLP